MGIWRKFRLASSAGLFIIIATMLPTLVQAERVGVLYAVHGGTDTWSNQASFDSAVQIFSYDENAFPHTLIWQPFQWPNFLGQSTAKFQGAKYDAEYPLLGGVDPFGAHTVNQFDDMVDALQIYMDYAPLFGVDTSSVEAIFTDRMSWISSDPADLPNPRGIYHAQGFWGTVGSPDMTYCGGSTDGGPWPGCDPDRFDVDGAVERMLQNNVDRIIIADMTMAGPRFFKTYDQLHETRKVIDAHNTANGTNVTVEWANDPTDVMTDSYPLDIIAPFTNRWTASAGAPTMDVPVPLAGRPNPFIEDPTLFSIISLGVREHIRDDIPISKQAVIMMNHHVRSNNQYFDPKIDDTVVVNEGIRAVLKQWYPAMDENNILGSWFGIKELNPANGQIERTRSMRGENLGQSWLYESAEVLPGGLDGYLYWDAIETLKDRGIEHIVFMFPQILTDSVLNLVEIHNEIAKEIGFKSWLYWDDGDFDNYPTQGHPFLDYWQPGAAQLCRLPGSSDPNVKEPCCFTMGGCPGSAQPYPPERQTALTSAISIDDPYLVYDVPEYGHLGYNPVIGAPDLNAPVQDQYTGTWAMWTPPNSQPWVGSFVALKVFKHLFPSP